jgi:branched-subunit amino acid transport protein
MEIALLILAMSLVTFIARYAMIAILGRYDVPPDVTRALAFVPIAAFAAIAAPELFLRDGFLSIGLANPRFVAGIAAAIAAFLSRNVLVTLATGMGVMWLVQVLIR